MAKVPKFPVNQAAHSSEGRQGSTGFGRGLKVLGGVCGAARRTQLHMGVRLGSVCGCRKCARSAHQCLQIDIAAYHRQSRNACT
jgi:hypothetical protein